MEKTLPWFSGYGSGLTGPTTPICAGPTAVRKYWPITKGRETIAIVVAQEGETLDDARARAAFIVRACNSHDALVEACEPDADPPGPDFLDWLACRLVSVYGESENVSHVRALRRKAEKMRAALAAAKGES